MIFGEEDSAQPMQNSNQNQQRVRLDMSRMETVYTNFFAMAGSPDEVVIFVGANSPLPGVAEPSLAVSHRLVMLPQNAKRLMVALQQTVKAHEDRFGPIEIGPPQQGK